MTVAPETAGDPGRLRELQRVLVDNPPIVLTVVFVALFVATDIVNRAQVGEPFLTAQSVSTTFLYACPLAMIAAGQTLVMLTAGVDLSVATTATAGAYAVAWQGANIGLVNGIGVGIFRVNPLVMTLGVSGVSLGMLTIYSGRDFTQVVPGVVKTLGSERFFTYVPWNLLVWAPVAALIILGLRYSGYGRMLYAVGDNPLACRLAGVRVWQVLVVVYALSGMLSALGGVMLLGFNNNADLGLATPFLLPSVAAVVIGGTSILGGFGGYGGTILGALILTVLDSLLTILDAEQGVKQILYGVIIISLAGIYARATGGD
jgi:ribose transport system permease protein